MAAGDEQDRPSSFVDTMQEDIRLEHLGYHQELKRSFGLLGMIGFSFSIVTCWTALSGVFIVGVNAGGPPVMIYSWIAVSLISLCVALPMAEMCSMYPVAGGQYSWVAILAPPRVARGLSYIAGWFMLIGIIAMGATNNFVTANFILGQANLVFPNYVIQRWQTVLMSWLIAFIAAAINLRGPQLLNRISHAILWWNICSFIIVTVTILATNHNKQPASFVFKEFQNFTGWGSGMAAIIGILQSCFGMCCYDTAAHMTEEMKNASKEAPLAIVMSVIMGAFTGFGFLLALCFCIGDIEATANTSTGVPIIQIFYDSTNSKIGACFLTSLITVIAIFASNSLLAEGSRAVYAFARDHGLPFSPFFSRVNSKTKVPIYAIGLTMGVQMILDAIYFGTVTGFETVISIATEGFYLSYAVPLFSRLLAYYTGHFTAFSGPWAMSVPVSLCLNAIGLVYLLFGSITFNFPYSAPVNKDSMNYTSAAIGVIGVISVVTWLTTGKKHFTGPRVTTVTEGSKPIVGEVVGRTAPQGGEATVKVG